MTDVSLDQTLRYNWKPEPVTRRRRIAQYLLNRELVSSDKLQDLEMFVSCSLSLSKFTPANGEAPQKFLNVSLVDTTLNPSGGAQRIMYDNPERRGWFTESIVVKISFLRNDGGWIKLVADAPETTEVSGSGSVSNSLSFDAGAGTLGGEPTLNVGLAASLGTSTTVSLNDFRVLRQPNHSTNTAQHEYRLGMLKDPPCEYTSWEDLLDNGAKDMISNLLSGQRPAQIRGIPDRAKYAFPIVSQALFRTSNDTMDNFTLRVSIDQTIVMAEAYGLLGQAAPASFSETFDFVIPFGRIH